MDHTQFYTVYFFWYRNSIQICQKITSFDTQITIKKKQKGTWSHDNCHAGHSKVHVNAIFPWTPKGLSHEWFIRNLFARHRLPPAIICDDNQKPECRSWHLFARHCFRERMKMRWRRLRETSGERLNRHGLCKTNIRKRERAASLEEARFLQV